MARIHIIGDIDEDLFARFDHSLSQCEAKKVKTVNVILSSPGGDSTIALAFHDRIKASSCTIHIICYGRAMSAAVLILAAGDTRRMAKNAWVMVHEDTSDLVEGHMRVREATKNINQHIILENQWNNLMAASTTTSPVMWARLHKAETYLTAQECLNLGLIDKVL